MKLHQILEIMRRFKLKRLKIDRDLVTGVTWKGEKFSWRLDGWKNNVSGVGQGRAKKSVAQMISR